MKRTNSAVCVSTLAVILAGAARAQSVRCVSVSPAGRVGNGESVRPSISADGRFVTFSSAASNLAAGDTSTFDVYVRDAWSGQTTCVSVDPAGAPGDDESYRSSVSDDGRWVAFASEATNLVAGDTNARTDAFVRDMLIGTTIRVSVSSSGAQALDGGSLGEKPAISGDGSKVAFASTSGDLVPGGSWPQHIYVHDLLTGQTTRASVGASGVSANDNTFNPSISRDGRYVAFDSYASNLVLDDTNSSSDVFVHDNSTGQTTRVSVNSSGAQGTGDSTQPSISADGRYVAFRSSAPNLVPNDTNTGFDVFVRDRMTGQTVRASVDSSGTQAPLFTFSSEPSISAGGRYVAFASNASTLVPGDTNAWDDVFVHDLLTGQTSRVSVETFGAQADFHSGHPSISADGCHVAFDSAATNLVAGDANNARDVFRRVCTTP